MNKGTWILLLGLFAVASTHTCEKDEVMHAEACFDNLTHYDERQFPSRGVGEHQLEEICNNWNESFYCVEHFTAVCNYHDNCDKTCQTLINKMTDVVKYSGLREVKDILCDESNEMRHAVASTHTCEKDEVMHAEACFDNLTRYDERQFPSRGVGEHQLEEICKNLNESFDCVEYFTATCNHGDKCDETCQKLIHEISRSKDIAGVREVRDVLCDESNDMRHAYLSESECFDAQMNKFDTCRHIWKKSYKYVTSTIVDKDEKIGKACCAATFYKGCIINATQDCDLEATDVVKYIFKKLFWTDDYERMCKDYPVCDKPLRLPTPEAKDTNLPLNSTQLSSSPSLVKPYSSWSFMYFMFLTVLLIK